MKICSELIMLMVKFMILDYYSYKVNYEELFKISKHIIVTKINHSIKTNLQINQLPIWEENILLK